jgi:hypothetical protein
MWTVPPDGNPYVGPRPFEAGDGRFFFGRDAELEDVLGLVLANQLVLLYAASGAGKSSLLNAAVLPRLDRDEQFEVLPAARVRALHDGPSMDGNIFAAAVVSHLAEGPVAAVALEAYLGERPHRRTSDGFDAPRVLVVDQLEEIFTAYPEQWEDRPAFFGDLAAALRRDPLLRAVLVIREDFLAQLSPFARLLPEGFRARYRLERLGRAAALRALREPARAAGRPFADGVAEQLVDDLRKVRIETDRGAREILDQFIEPVQLQVVAHTLWEALPAAATEISEEHRRRFGNVDEVLRDFYDGAIAAAAAAARVREGPLRNAFARAFITPMGTRSTVVWLPEGAGGMRARAIEELDARHLIRAEHRAGARWYELTHDRLIEPVRASNQLRVARRRERRRRAIAGGGLLVGLAAAGVAVAALARSQSSSAVRVTTTTTRTVAGGRSFAKPLARGPGGVGSIFSITYVSPQAAYSLDSTQPSPLTPSSPSNGGRGLLLVGDFGTRLLDASNLQSLRSFRLLKGGRQRLAAAYRGRFRLETFLPLPTDNVRGGELELSGRPVFDGKSGPTFVSVALSRTGRYAAVGDSLGRIVVVDTRRSVASVQYAVPGARLATPAFGVGDSHVLFAGSNGTIERASTTRRQRSTLARVSPGQTAGIAVSADGALIAAYGANPELVLLDGRGRRVGTLPGANVVAAAFSPSGDRLALARADETVEVWATLPDLTLDQPRLFRGRRRSTIEVVVRNFGTSRSTPTWVASGGVRRPVRALASGELQRIRLRVSTPPRHIPVLVAVAQSRDGEQSLVNNERYGWALGDTRARIVAAARTAILPGRVVRNGILQAQAFQGVLQRVRLPDVPNSANSVMFATWCYEQAGAPDPNGLDYQTAVQQLLETNGTGLLKANGKVASALRPGDLVFYDAHLSTAVYVGGNRVVRWKKTKRAWALRETPLRTPGDRILAIRSYLK